MKKNFLIFFVGFLLLSLFFNSAIAANSDPKKFIQEIVDEAKKIGLIMSYPTINSVDPDTYGKEVMKTKQMFDLLANTVYQVYEGDKIQSAGDYTKEELHKFLESLDSKAYRKINEFFDTMPKLKQDIEIENPKTKVKSKLTLSGLADFFVLPSLTNR